MRRNVIKTNIYYVLMYNTFRLALRDRSRESVADVNQKVLDFIDIIINKS